MTTTTTKNRINQTADGVQLIFPYDFIVQNDSHMKVYLDNVLQATGYTVSGVGDPAGGSVTFDAAPANDVIVTLQRVVPVTQLVDYLPYDPFPSETHETALDKLTLIAQQLTDEISRAIKADVTTADGVNYTLPGPVAGSFIQWNVTEDGFVNVHISDLGDLVATTPFTETLLDDADADEFWATLMATLTKTTARSSLDVYSKAEADAYANIPARNVALTKDVLSQAGTSTPGFSVSLAAVDDGIDGTQYLRWTKDRNNVTNWIQSDSVRGDFYLSSNLTAAEVATIPALDADDVSFQWSLTKTASGLTNRNKAYTAHYNTQLGISVVGYEGDGIDGHEIPHHLGVVPKLSIFKNRDNGTSWWIAQSSLFDAVSGEYLRVDAVAALATSSDLKSIFGTATSSISSNISINESASNHIMYSFASVEGVSKIDKYIGTGAAGNYVDCGFKPAFVLIKELTGTGNWTLTDSIRTEGESILPNTSGIETTDGDIYFDDNGFYLNGTDTDTNTLNAEYIFIAFAETSIDANKVIADYVKPTNADELAVVNPLLLTFANGFNDKGQIDVQEEIAGSILTFGVGHEDKKYYLYRDKDTSFGQTEVRPLVGLTRDLADYSGVVSPGNASLRTTAKHFDYESETGIALASDEISANYAYQAFNKDSNDVITILTSYWGVASTTTSWLQYKYKEKRILKSWRLREYSTQSYTPRLFTIEGSNDGFNWTAIDSSYTASDYVGNGASLWGDEQDTSANVTGYFYYRINITANNGHASSTIIAELEFNTKIASDYYLIDEAKIFNDTGTRLDRVYIGECLTDANGDVVSFVNYAAGKSKLNELEVHGEAKFYGDLKNEMVDTAFALIDQTVNPPLILMSKNVADIVDTGTGRGIVLFEERMNDLDYSATVTGSNGNAHIGVMSSSIKNLNGFEYLIYTTAAALVDDIVFISVKGGKEIK